MIAPKVAVVATVTLLVTVVDDPAVLEPDVTPSSSVVAAPAVPIAPLWKRLLPWAVAAVGLGAALVLLSLWAPWRTQPPPAPRRLRSECDDRNY